MTAKRCSRGARETSTGRLNARSGQIAVGPRKPSFCIELLVWRSRNARYEASLKADSANVRLSGLVSRSRPTPRNATGTLWRRRSEERRVGKEGQTRGGA